MVPILPFSKKKGEKEAYMIERTSSVSARHVFFFFVSFPPLILLFCSARGEYRSLWVTGPICPNVPKRPFSCLALKEQQRQFRHFPSWDDIVAGRYKTFKTWMGLSLRARQQPTTTGNSAKTNTDGKSERERELKGKKTYTECCWRRLV